MNNQIFQYLLCQFEQNRLQLNRSHSDGQLLRAARAVIVLYLSESEYGEKSSKTVLVRDKFPEAQQAPKPSPQQA